MKQKKVSNHLFVSVLFFSFIFVLLPNCLAQPETFLQFGGSSYGQNSSHFAVSPAYESTSNSSGSSYQSPGYAIAYQLSAPLYPSMRQVLQPTNGYQLSAYDLAALATREEVHTYSAQQFNQYFHAIKKTEHLTHSMKLEILNAVEDPMNFYACDGFREYIKTFGILYEDFILELRSKIHGKFEERLRDRYPKIGNFKNEAAGWFFYDHNDKWAFRDWVQSEVENIHRMRTDRAVQAALQQKAWEKEQKELAIKKAAEQKALELKKQQEEADRQLKECEELARIRKAQEALEAQEHAQRLAEEQKIQALQQAHELRVQAAASFWTDKDQREKIINKFARKAVNLHEHVEINLLNMLKSESNDAIIDPINFIKQNPELEEYQRKFNNRLNAQIKKIRSLQREFRQALQEIAQEDFVHEIHGDEVPAGMLEAAQAHEEKQARLREALKKTYTERHMSQVDQQQQPYQVFLHRLAKSYVKQADQAYLRGDTFFVQRYQERSAAIIETLTITMQLDGTKTIEHMKKIVVRDKTCNFNMGGMCDKSYFGDTFSTYQDTPIDRLLHREIKTTLQQTSDLIDQYSDNPYAHGNAAVIYHGAASARLETNNERALLLSDFCHYFAQATAGLAALTATSMRCIGYLGSGWVDGIVYNFSRWKDHPIESACFAVMGPLTSAGAMLAQAAYIYVTDREKFYHACQQLNELRKNASPEQVCYLLGYFFGPGITKKYTGKFAKSLKQMALQTRFLKAVQQQEKIKVAIEGVGDFNQNFIKTIQPIKTVVQKAAQQVNQAGKNIANAGKNAVQGATATLYKTLSDEVFATFGTKMPRINWKHVFCGEVDSNNTLKGFHDARSYPEKIIKVTLPPDQHGIFKADFLHQGLTKNSTFFPKDWNRVKIIEKINEAYNNIKEMKQSGFVGETLEGIKIQIWFKKLPTGEIIINSVYPKM